MGNTIKGNGNIITTTLPIEQEFHSIQNNSCADIIYNDSPDYRVEVTSDSNLVEFVKIDILLGKLNISMKDGSYKFTRLQIHVFCPILNDIYISGSGHFECQNDSMLKGENVMLRVKGSGVMNVKIACQNLNTEIKGSGDIKCRGYCEDAIITIQGSSDFKGRLLQAKNVIATSQGSGDINVNVSESLQATVKGSGDIIYVGNPNINVKSKIIGSGKIKNDNQKIY
jgi:hypothetical protein